MPTNESEELAGIRQAAEYITTRRREVEDVRAYAAGIAYSDLLRIEQVLWSAYTRACEAEALRELHGQEATPA